MFVKRLPEASGFTLIEMAVALSIACILMALGAPAISGYLQNARLGSMAQSFYGGLQTARAEAVKRNQNVEFVLTSSPLATTAFDAVAADMAGHSWVVRVPTAASAPAVLIEQKASNDGEVGSITVAASGPTGGTVLFNSLGGVVAGAPTVYAFTNLTLGQCTPLGQVRCWNVVVSAGGQVRICSPDATLAVTDSRAC